MSVSRAFDLAQWVGAPVNINDGVVVSALGPPFVSAFKPVVTSLSPGVTVGSSVPAATAAGQTLVSGAGPGFVWGAAAGGSGGGIAEAPTDGQVYARQSAAWVVVVTGGGGIPDAPSDGTAYIRQNGAWSNVFDAGTF